jgi:hypothetical protein
MGMAMDNIAALREREMTQFALQERRWEVFWLNDLAKNAR